MLAQDFRTPNLIPLAMMSMRYPSEWLAKAADTLARVAENPWALFVLLLVVNTVTQPYMGITHDTRLYSVQVLNQVEDGSYADDLFFRYGSQDQYSLFSRLAAPLVRLLGLPTAFFLIYLFSKSLLFFGMIRLVQTLVPHRVAGVLALVYGAAVSMNYGGLHVLNVQEAFVTPRIPACALVLIGLDLLLRGRPIASGLMILVALTLHPLMAFGGFLIWAGLLLWTKLGVKTVVAALLGSCALAGVVLAVEPLGQRCFGTMDDVWRQSILHASPFNFPSEWSRNDWCYLAIQLAVLGIAIGKYRSADAVKPRFLIVLLLVTLAGTAGSMLAERLPYALLLQGQPYRTLWILAFLHLAFAFWLCVEWSQSASWLGQLAGCALLAYVCSADGLPEERWQLVLPVPLLVVVLRGLERVPRDPAWLLHSVQCSVVLGAIAWAGYKWMLLIGGVRELLEVNGEAIDLAELFLRNFGPVVLLAGICWLLVRVGAELLESPCLAVRGGLRRRAGSCSSLSRRRIITSRTARNTAGTSVPFTSWCIAIAPYRTRCRRYTATWGVSITFGSICTRRAISTGGKRATLCSAATWPSKAGGERGSSRHAKSPAITTSNIT